MVDLRQVGKGIFNNGKSLLVEIADFPKDTRPQQKSQAFCLLLILDDSNRGLKLIGLSYLKCCIFHHHEHYCSLMEAFDCDYVNTMKETAKKILKGQGASL